MAVEKSLELINDIASLQRRIDDAKEGEIVELASGTIMGCLIIDKAITLKGVGPDSTVLDGCGEGPTISIDVEEGMVSIEDLCITGGNGPFGGGISIDNGAQVHLTGCLLDGNVAATGRGGAVAIDRGLLKVTECTIVSNQAFQGGAIFAGGLARVEISACVMSANAAIQGGAMAALHGAEVEVWTSRLEHNRAEDQGHHLFLYSGKSQACRTVLSNTILGAAEAVGLPISNLPGARASLVIDNSMIDRSHMRNFVVG